MADARGDADDGRRLAASWQNRAAGRVLRAARNSMPEGGAKQAAFAARLSRATGVPVSVSTLSNWETGRRTVPGPMLIEATIASGSSMDALLASAGEPATEAWGQTLTFPQRVAELESELQQHAALLAAAMNELAAVKATMERAGLRVEGAGDDRLRTGTER